MCLDIISLLTTEGGFGVELVKGDIETIKRQKQKQNLELEKCNI